MTGPKLNECETVAGQRTGTRASARNVRMSASKARVVLDLIRGLDVVSADQVLQFTERDAAIVVRKVLASAVANAVNNSELDAATLFVRACYADEGPTMKRFRPRARGRAGRVNKRTCHIVIVVDVLDEDTLKIVVARRERALAGRRAGRGVADRRARVEKSRQRRSASGDSTEVDESTNDTTNDTTDESINDTTNDTTNDTNEAVDTPSEENN